MSRAYARSVPGWPLARYGVNPAGPGVELASCKAVALNRRKMSALPRVARACRARPVAIQLAAILAATASVLLGLPLSGTDDTSGTSC